MTKELDELTNIPKDPNSPESQKFLRDLQQQIQQNIEEKKNLLKQWNKEKYSENF